MRRRIDDGHVSQRQCHGGRTAIRLGTFVATLVLVGCKAGGDAGASKPKHDLKDYCSLLGNALERRAAPLEERRPYFEKLAQEADADPTAIDSKGLPDRGEPSAEFVAYAADLEATLGVAWQLGMRCARSGEEPECQTIYGIHEIFEPGSLERMSQARRNIRDALKGKGPCVAGSDPVQGLDPCDELAMRLRQVEGLTQRTAGSEGLEPIADARAIIDYGTALLAFCTTAALASSCTYLGEGLGDAPPLELEKRATTLRRAVGGTTCEVRGSGQ
ncbi:MAG: hypothetical protein HS111_10110 [Kofleriaceae bacterium]|nr:hypothetical protein [Kofleriaceae bacterium]